MHIWDTPNTEKVEFVFAFLQCFVTVALQYHYSTHVRLYLDADAVSGEPPQPCRLYAKQYVVVSLG